MRRHVTKENRMVHCRRARRALAGVSAVLALITSTRCTKPDPVAHARQREDVQVVPTDAMPAATPTSTSIAGALDVDAPPAAPASMTAYGAGRVRIASHTFAARPDGPEWDCFYHYFLPVAVAGVDLATPMTPKAGDPVAIMCYEDGRLVHSEAFVFDPARPFGALVEPVSDEAAVRNTIDAMWAQVLEAASNPPRPDDPELSKIVTGSAWAMWTSKIEELKTNGHHVQLSPTGELRRSVVSIRFTDDNIAIVDECIVDDLVVIASSSGDIVDAGVTTYHAMWTLARVEGTWLVTVGVERPRVQGVQPCAG